MIRGFFFNKLSKESQEKINEVKKSLGETTQYVEGFPVEEGRTVVAVPIIEGTFFLEEVKS